MTEDKDSVILSASNKKTKGICVICRVPLIPCTDQYTDPAINSMEYSAMSLTEPIETDKQYNVLRCPDCNRTYFTQSEIVEYEDEPEFVHDDEDTELTGTGSITGGGILRSAEHEFDDTKLKPLGDEKTGHDYIKKYLGSHVKITEYHEENVGN